MHRTFQYISCYCLSRYEDKDIIEGKNFNTSHVTVYQRQGSRFVGERHFNTSHVTVYQKGVLLVKCSIIISIHLMLLFITCRGSCTRSDLRISIHLMLLFI